MRLKNNQAANPRNHRKSMKFTGDLFLWGAASFTVLVGESFVSIGLDNAPFIGTIAG